jgi:tetratricopeptide (TPR) repeat protein
MPDLDGNGDPHFRAEYRFILGGTLYRTGRYDEARMHLRRALDEVHESGDDPVLTGKIMVSIGHILFVQREIDAAITHYQTAVDLFGSVRDYHTQGTIYAGLSLAMKRKGDMGRALHYAQLGASLFRAGNDIRDMASLLNNMAVALQEHGDLERATDVAEQALERAQQAGALDMEAAVHGTLASIYLAGGDLDRAGQEAALAGDLARDDSDPARIDSWRALAEIAERQGNPERSDVLFGQVLAGLRQSGRWTRYVEVALAYSDVLQKRGDIAGALQYAREAAHLQVTQSSSN